MIDQETLVNFTRKKETTLLNISREYLQNLFLKEFYKKTGSENFVFKGGTALRLVFGSPRFSEDLDFSGIKNGVIYEKVLEEVLFELSLANLRPELVESKKTSGGFLSILGINLFEERIKISQEISFRPKKLLAKESVIVTHELLPAYRIYLLEKKNLVKEKVTALLARNKPRDFFDLYFIFRNEELRQVLELEKEEREMIFSLLKKADKEKISKELKSFLPKSFWPLIKNLPGALKGELVK